MSKTGVCGWPLVASIHFKGELTIGCPRCASTDVTLTILPGPFGTGPRGIWRMGDYGGKDLNICNACGHRSTDVLDG